MKKIILCFIFCSLAQLTVETDVLSSKINSFSNKVSIKIESKKEDGNFVISPFSLHSAFSQLLLGTRGKTRHELRSFLDLHHQSRSGFINDYNSLVSSMDSLGIANMLALVNGFTPKPKYAQALKLAFGTEVKEFGSDYIKTVKEINDYVAKNTNEKIKDILTNDQINPDTRFAIINAVYFKANWKYQFDPKNTYHGEFKTVDNRIVKTKFMTMKTNASISFTDKLTILELPYDDGTTSMMFLLPKDKSSRNIMNLMSDLSFSSLKFSEPIVAEITIPKFKMDYNWEDTKTDLKTLGVKTIFSSLSANLTDISENAALSISYVIHKAFIEVDEKGTEAAAATVIIGRGRSGGGPYPFRLDRPFGFVIYDKSANIPLFTGKIADPSKL